MENYIKSVDQLNSPTAGLISQMVERSTTKRYKYATVFVDYTLRLAYIYLQKVNNVIETLEAKTSFQHHSLDRESS